MAKAKPAAPTVKPKSKPSKPEAVGIAYRFTRMGVELARLNDGHLWVFRAGDLEPGCIVRAKDGPFHGRIGRVRQLVASWGGAVIAVVHWQSLSNDKRRPGVLWSRDELEVLRQAKGAKRP